MANEQKEADIARLEQRIADLVTFRRNVASEFGVDELTLRKRLQVVDDHILEQRLKLHRLRDADRDQAARSSAKDVLDAAFRRYSPRHCDSVRTNLDPKLVAAIEEEITQALLRAWL